MPRATATAPRRTRSRAVAAAFAALAATAVCAAPTISVGVPAGVAFVFGQGAIGSVTIQPSGGILITSTDLTPLASLAVCFDRRLGPFLEDEDALVPPGAESMAPVGVTHVWAKSQTAAGGGCLTLTAPPAGISAAAMADLAWQVRYLNGGPLGGPTTGDRALTLTVTDTAGAVAWAPLSISVANGPALAGVCPVVLARQALDVLPAQLAGGGGVRVAGAAALTDPDGAGAIVNAHARITGGCVPSEDVLALDASTGLPLTIGSVWFPETCDLTLYALPAATTTVGQWQAALRAVLYRNLAAGGAAAVGTRTVTLSVGQAPPAECRSSYGLATINLVASLPTPSPPPTPSAPRTPAATPSLTPTPLDLAGLGSATGEPPAEPLAESGARALCATAAGLAVLVLSAVLTL